jgi:hypothetical protein
VQKPYVQMKTALRENKQESWGFNDDEDVHGGLGFLYCVDL